LIYTVRIGAAKLIRSLPQTNINRALPNILLFGSNRLWAHWPVGWAGPALSKE
jgi:hypothetical protein